MKKTLVACILAMGLCCSFGACDLFDIASTGDVSSSEVTSSTVTSNEESQSSVEEQIVTCTITFKQNGTETELEAEGNGTLSAINNALSSFSGEQYTLQVFTQHSMQGQGSRSVAASYIGLERENGSMYWGVGTDTDVITANTKALLSAFCNMKNGDK